MLVIASFFRWSVAFSKMRVPNTNPDEQPTKSPNTSGSQEHKDEGNTRGKIAVRYFLETTSVKGVPKLVKASNWCLRLLWTLALIFGFGTATYFLTSLFISFANFSANVQLNEIPVHSEDFPDITICNLNPFANTPYGTKHIEELFDTARNEHNPTLRAALGDPSFDIFKLPLFQEIIRPGKLMEFIVDEFPEKGYNETKQFLLYCSWDTDIENYDCLGTATIQLHTTDYGYCFTFHRPPNSTAVNGFSAILYLDRYSFVTHMPSIPVGLGNVFTDGARVVIHSPQTQPILSEGVNVEAGEHTTISVQLNRVDRLGRPYNDCDDKLNVNMCWPDMGFGDKIKYRREYCEYYCKQWEVLRNCDCITGSIPSIYSMRKNVSFCGHFGAYTIMELLNNMKNKVDCVTQHTKSFTCPALCDEDRYDFNMFRSNWPHTSYQLAFYDELIRGQPYEAHFAAYKELLHSDNHSYVFTRLGELDGIHRNFLQLNVIWQTDTAIVFKEQASLTAESLIGTLGGILNLWVGMSFITVIELCELMINCCICRQRKNKIHTSS